MRDGHTTTTDNNNNNSKNNNDKNIQRNRHSANTYGDPEAFVPPLAGVSTFRVDELVLGELVFEVSHPWIISEAFLKHVSHGLCLREEREVDHNKR